MIIMSPRFWWGGTSITTKTPKRYDKDPRKVVTGVTLLSPCPFPQVMNFLRGLQFLDKVICLYNGFVDVFAGCPLACIFIVIFFLFVDSKGVMDCTK